MDEHHELLMYCDSQLVTSSVLVIFSSVTDFYGITNSVWFKYKHWVCKSNLMSLLFLHSLFQFFSILWLWMGVFGKLYWA